jgi:hypothetical protein
MLNVCMCVCMYVCDDCLASTCLTHVHDTTMNEVTTKATIILMLMCCVLCGVVAGSCSHKTALSWGLQSGQLSYNNGQLCVVRTPDNLAALAPCASAFEYIGLEVPTLHT